MAAFTAACVQLRSGLEPEKNVADASAFIREAAAAGATFIATPEMTHVVDLRPRRLFGVIQDEAKTQALKGFRALATELGVTLLIGSLAIKLEDRRAANRSFLIGPNGDILTRYDKIHMFDVDLPNGESYKESNVYEAGTAPVLADIEHAVLGLTICYDVRFPGLYQALSKGGASVLAVPAAFTQQTGEAHWKSLLRARAIENGAYVVAPAQGGLHEDGRRTYGHSLIIDPWGKVLAEADGDAPGVILAEIDTDRSADARRQIPNLSLEKSYEIQNSKPL